MSLLALFAALAVNAGFGADAGVLHAEKQKALARTEDQEVIENLELLEHLDVSSDLELLQELSVER